MTIFDFYLWPLHVMKAWAAFFRLVPEVLTQPILPGWTLGNVYNISESNSSAPQTEQAIVSRHSYGRQLGRMSDALSVLVARTLQEDRLSEADMKRLADFTELTRRIDEIKSREALKRVERLAAELASLERTNPILHRRAVELLKPQLKIGSEQH
jgi:hypothetical protein